MRLIRTLIYIVVGILIMGLAAVFLIPKETVADNAIAQLEKQIGRDVSVGDDISFSIFPDVEVTLNDVRIANADWSTDEPYMLQANSFSVGVELASVFNGPLKIKYVEADAADVFLHRSVDGQANWEFESSSDVETSSEDATDSSAVLIETVAVTDSNVTFLDGANDPLSFENLDATLDQTANSGATEVSVAFDWQGERLTATADIANLEDLLAGLPTTAVVNADIADAELNFNGTVSTDANVSGDINLNARDVGKLASLAGGDPSSVQGPLDLSGVFTVSDGQRVLLDEGRLISSLVNGQFDVDADLSGTKPIIDANITADELGSPSSGDTDGSSSNSEWSSDPIDASFLGAFDGTINVTANKIHAGPLTFAPANAIVTVDNSRAVATLTNLAGYGGAVTGQFVMNNRSGLSVGGNLNAAEVGLKDFLNDLIGVDRFTGTGNLSMEFLSSGGSMAAIMNSLSGTGALDVGSGTIAGIDLDSLFRGESSGGTTIFDSLSASWNIANGTMSNEDLLMLLPSLESTGLGTIGLGAQNMDYTLSPTLKTGDDAGTMFPIRIIGDWANLSIYPDLEAIIQQDLGEQVEAIKTEVKEAVQQELQQQLGLSGDDVETPEESIEKSLEDEVKKELQNLLGLD